MGSWRCKCSEVLIYLACVVSGLNNENKNSNTPHINSINYILQNDQLKL